jgi:hypothetical protein
LEGEEPNPGPEMDTVYIPGTLGGAWTKEEVDSTRLYFIFKYFLLGCLISLAFLGIPILPGCCKTKKSSEAYGQ